MHYHVLGLGPVGCLLAHNLRRVLPSTLGISLIHKTRQNELALLEKGSIQVDTFGAVTTSSGFLSEEFENTNQSPQQQGDRVQNLKHIESLFVALKAQHTVDALKTLTYRLSANSTIVLMQNGMGLYEQLLRDVFRNPSQRPHFILASNTHGAFTTQPFHVIHSGIGSIDFGIAPDSQGRDYETGFYDENIPHSQRRPRLSDITSPTDVGSIRYTSLRDTVAALLLLEPLSTSWKTYAELQLIMRRKLAVNAVINPLTALMGCRNGELTRLPFASRTMHMICWEASLVYAAEMRRESTLWLEDMESRGVDSKDVTLPSLPKSLTTECLEDEVVRVAQLTKNNVSSMLQDVRRGKTTEIGYINGYLMRYHIPLDQML
ncbi:6-phosphogluconate dehydrogenase C-terminal domain-like protein [Phlegmacium glaucopus]|nr:6-phosphogluconate dehydrogenase C-terminal domain-like protein [Phlegmacium glaucopus]